MDLTPATAPRSDQQNYDDYVTGPKTVTVSEVRRGNAEQPVEVHLAEFPGRPYKPSKSMIRVLVKGWGPDSDLYAGRRMTLYGDPSVRYGGKPVGGIRISHMSNIDGPLLVPLTITRGKKEPFTVQPLPDAPAQAPQTDWQARLAAVKGDPDAAQALYTEAQQAGAPDNYLAAVQAAGQEQ